MNWSELIDKCNLSDIEVTVINPVRNDAIYKKGMLGGFKAGVVGGGWSSDRKSFSSAKIGFIKKPKVLVLYPVAQIYPGNGKQHTDWIDVDNCIFELKKQDEQKVV